MKSRVADFQRKAAPVVQEKDEAWFEAQLSAKCPEAYVKGSDFMIRCPFHADNDPSCGVDRWTGVFNCWSCNANGHWNKLARQLGMQTLKVIGAFKTRRFKDDEVDDAPVRTIEVVHDTVARALTKMGIRPHEREEKGDLNRPLVHPWPANKDNRGVPGEFLKDLGCVRVLDLAVSPKKKRRNKHTGQGRGTIERLGLPVRTPEGDLVGYTCRAIEPADADPKYSPLSADRFSWRDKELPAKSSLFLVEKVLEEGWDRVVIVEGPLDAIKLYYNGIPAISILGTANWTSIKASILIGLGLKAAIVLMDNDRSGKDVQPVIVNDLQHSMRVLALNLPEGVKDPDVMSPKQLAWLNKKLESL